MQIICSFQVTPIKKCIASEIRAIPSYGHPSVPSHQDKGRFTVLSVLIVACLAKYKVWG